MVDQENYLDAKKIKRKTKFTQIKVRVVYIGPDGPGAHNQEKGI